MISGGTFLVSGMNWEQSKVLTLLKRDFLRAFFARNQAFFLTGGSALGIFYLEHRVSYDLDFFTTEPDPVDWHVLQNQLLGIAAEWDAQCRSLIATPEFHRFELVRGSEHELLDFVVERVPQVDPKKEVFAGIRVDTLREIIANKLCTLLSRCEVKDVIDLYFLQQRCGDLLTHLADARQKEGGLDPAMLSFLLADFRVERIPEYVRQPLEPATLNEFIATLRKQLAAAAYPKAI